MRSRSTCLNWSAARILLAAYNLLRVGCRHERYRSLLFMTTQFAMPVPRASGLAPAISPPAAVEPMHVALQHVRMGYSDRVIFPSLSAGFPRGKISVIL